MATTPDRVAKPEPPGHSYSEPDVLALLDHPHEGLVGHREVPKARQIFVNRNLRMDKIELVGFDMDYTLAIYHLRRLEELAFDMTLARMIAHLGYPAQLGAIKYDADFVLRGLVMDKQAGNIFKMDRFNHCGRCYHGRKPVPYEEMKRLYREEKIHLSLPRFAWIDTLFALPEASLFAEIIELLESRGDKVDYGKLYDDIRESIDTVHRDNTLKTEIRKDFSRYILKDAELGPALHKLRSGGKKLFVLTNSLFDYTDAVMSYILDGVLPEYPSWKNYFDIIITGSAKPAFFSERRPFLEVEGGEREPMAAGAAGFERGHLYEGGNLVDFERLAGIGGERVLYVGDHIYGDILRSKKSSLWRTCMVVQEIEDEIAWLEKNHEKVEEMGRLEDLRARLDDEVGARKTALNVLDRKLDRNHVTAEEREALEHERKALKPELEKLRRAQRDVNARIELLEREVEEGYNRYWGLIFKEGNENSRFGEQVEDYACLYTSRVSNFGFYSPMQYFRSLRAFMPHERGAPKIAPFGDEHAMPAAGARPSKAPR